MKIEEAEYVYRYHVERTNVLLNSMGDNPQIKNAFITNTYRALSEKESAFLWFSLGTIVSSTVGQNLQVATQTSIISANQVESAKVVLENFSKGNQAIFKNIVPLFLTYESIGIEGIELLKNSEVVNPFKNKLLLDAMRAYSSLQIQQSIIANSLGLSTNDFKVIDKLFSDQKNIALIHSIAMGIANLEQNTVQDIYEDKLVDIILDPTLSWGGHQLNLDVIKILDKSYNFSDYIDNPADLDQRLYFAEILLTAIEEGISKGEFLKIQADVLKMAEHTLWMANPYTASHTIGEINGAYWGPQAEEYDKKVKESVLAFLNQEHSDQESTIISFIDTNEQNIFPSIFSGEHEIVKVNVDPLTFFLEKNPNYELIARDFTELWNSPDYYHQPIYKGTALVNVDKPFLTNSTYIIHYDDGENHYFPPQGEVRGITFPFLYDKATGIPLTMPMLDSIGHYEHVSTMDTIYNHPEAFNTPSHINWYNPYWNQLVTQTRQNAMNNYFKSITVDALMNAVTAPIGTSIHYDSSKPQLKLKTNDIFGDNSSNIDFSSLKGTGTSGGNSSYKMAITSMELANGSLLEVNNQGNFVCSNCNAYDAMQLEYAANSILHSV